MSAAGSVRDRLRAATATAHLELERGLDLVSRLDDRRDVVLILTRLHGLFARTEAALDATLGERIMRGRHRTPALARDLGALGLTDDEIARLPMPEPVALEGRDMSLGALYVLEGTRLGGRIIAREAAGRDWVPAAGLAFWRDDPDSGPLWRAFLVELEASGDVEACVRGALAMFEACTRWLVRIDDRRD